MRRDYYLAGKEKRQKQRSMGPEWKEVGLTIGRETKGAHKEVAVCVVRGVFPHSMPSSKRRQGWE